MENNAFYDAQRWIAILGSILVMISVAAGAFGAHSLRQTISPNSLNIFEVAARYQMYHGFALLIISCLLGIFPHGLFFLSAGFFIVGTVIFSGSLYLLALTGIRWLGAFTPIGGIFFLLGWACFIISLIKSDRAT